MKGTRHLRTGEKGHTRSGEKSGKKRKRDEAQNLVHVSRSCGFECCRPNTKCTCGHVSLVLPLQDTMMAALVIHDDGKGDNSLATAPPLEFSPKWRTSYIETD
eukprot:5066568-Pleurochrysis_carterae.AAC.1